ncbi:MAG TPA: hypothetical protein VM427_08465 [Patescibacteria group bacterium]|nr:hypothetical protein [Patescibacteria group bacterium]
MEVLIPVDPPDANALTRRLVGGGDHDRAASCRDGRWAVRAWFGHPGGHGFAIIQRRRGAGR